MELGQNAAEKTKLRDTRIMEQMESDLRNWNKTIAK